MISIAYINGEHEPLLLSDPFVQLESFIEETMTESDNIYNDYMNRINMFVTESSIMNESFDGKLSDELILESSNIFEKIGESIIKIANKIKDFFSQMLDRMRGFYKKTDLEKISEVAKKNPAVADDIVAAFNKGDLTVYDAKSIKEIENAYMELVKHAKDPNVTPDNFAGKVKLFKNKCENADKSGLVSVAKATTAVVGAASALILLPKVIPELRNSANNCNLSSAKVMDATVDAIHEIEARGTDDAKRAVSGELGKAKQLEAISEWTGMKLLSWGQHSNSKFTKITDAIKSTINKIDKSGKVSQKIAAKDAEKKAKDIDDAKKFAQTARDKYDLRNPKTSREEERKKNRQDAADKAYGQAKGQHDFNGKHQQSILGRERVKAQVQAQGREDAYDDDREYTKAYDKAYAQQEARTNYENRPGAPKKKSIRQTAKEEQLGRFDAIDERNKKKTK